MKFDCDSRKEERNRRYTEKWKAREEYLTNWHDYFCWYPIRIARKDCRWLEKVQRRFVNEYSSWGLVTRYEYREKAKT